MGTQKQSPTGPFILVSIGTVPGMRGAHFVMQAAESLLAQTRVPDRLLVVSPRKFARWPNESVDLTKVQKSLDAACSRRHLPTTIVGHRYCERDYGPGSKILCALPALKKLARTSSTSWTLVVADDDKLYKPWALAGLHEVIRQAQRWASTPRHFAFSYLVHSQWMSGTPRTKGLIYRSGRYGGPPVLRLGQGADLFAMPADALLESSSDSRGPLAFYRCALAVEPMLRWHDDLWLSTYLLLRSIVVVQVPVLWIMRGTISTHSWQRMTFSKEQSHDYALSLIHI